MRIFFLLLFCIVSVTTAYAAYAAQTCKPDSIPATTPDSQLLDNGDYTITDLKTGLMWRKCLEGVSGDSCEIGSPTHFTCQQARQQPITINNADGFAGYTDWRLPNIKELVTLVEEQCHNPAINLHRFPNTSSISVVWSGSSSADPSSNPVVWSGASVADDGVDFAWGVGFYNGYAYGLNCNDVRNSVQSVRLVRSTSAIPGEKHPKMLK